MLKATTKQVIMRNQASQTLELVSMDTTHPERSLAESFVINKFAQAYGADISTFMPNLVCLKQNDQISACIGVRNGDQPLFLEQYLNCTIQQAHPELDIPREQIAELGNLVSEGRQYTLLLFLLIAQVLHQVGYKQIVFAATKQVAHILRRSGHHLDPIVEADGHRLGKSLAQWGSYYQQQPTVMRMGLEEINHIINNSPFLMQLTRDYGSQMSALNDQLGA